MKRGGLGGVRLGGRGQGWWRSGDGLLRQREVSREGERLELFYSHTHRRTHPARTCV